MSTLDHQQASLNSEHATSAACPPSSTADQQSQTDVSFNCSSTMRQPHQLHSKQLQEQLLQQQNQGIPLQSHQGQQSVMQMYERLAQLNSGIKHPRRQRLQHKLQQLMPSRQVQQHKQDKKHDQALGHQDSQQMQLEEECIVRIAATAATDAVVPIAGAGSRTNAQDTVPQLNQQQGIATQQMTTHQDQPQSPSCTQQRADPLQSARLHMQSADEKSTIPETVPDSAYSCTNANQVSMPAAAMPAVQGCEPLPEIISQDALPASHQPDQSRTAAPEVYTVLASC